MVTTRSKERGTGGFDGAGRYAATVVHYPVARGARAALVIATDPGFATVECERTENLSEVAPYRPGEFFARELPALRAVLTGVRALDLIVVDGYVDLDAKGATQGRWLAADLMRAWIDRDGAGA
ncbi:MAG: hypothetical protein ACQSGP_06565 [Frankia sp.]